MITYHKIEQGSPEWHKEREDKLTASNATPIAANGAGLKTYCKSIAIKMLGLDKDSYYNEDMLRGHEFESIAISSYEFTTGFKVDSIGFMSNDKYPRIGMSPDGLINIAGGVEAKARNDEKHFSLLIGDKKEIPNNQIQMSLLLSERKWWDFISYNPNFSKPLFIERIYPDLAYFSKLKIGFIEGIKLIDYYINKYNDY